MNKTELLNILRDKEIRSEIIEILRETQKNRLMVTQFMNEPQLRKLNIEMYNTDLRESFYGKDEEGS